MANDKNLEKRTATQFTSGEVARKAQKKSVESRKRNTAERKLIKEAILERLNAKDMQEIADGVIARAKESAKDFEVFRDTIGEKPIENVNMQAQVNNPFAGLSTEELKKMIGE